MIFQRLATRHYAVKIENVGTTLLKVKNVEITLMKVENVGTTLMKVENVVTTLVKEYTKKRMVSDRIFKNITEM